MLLAIAAELSAPPSSPAVFRDVTLYSRTFKGYDVVAYAEQDMKDYYALWFRAHGLFDFVEELLTIEEAIKMRFDVEIEGGPDSRLTAHNLWQVINLL